MTDENAGPLADLVVLDATDASGAYCARLLADLGADVIRIESPEGDPMRSHEPTVTLGSGAVVSCFERFVNLNKRSVTVDPSVAAGRALVMRLVARCDVLLDTPGADGGTIHGLTPVELDEVNPGIVRVSITAFGCEGPYAGFSGDDLTTIASGGLLSLAGYDDTSPIAAYGEQTYFARSLFAASGALLALFARERDGAGRRVDVSGQEAVANALEDALPEFDLNGSVRRRVGELPREAGTGTFACADGYVTVVAGRLGTSAAWAALVAWMDERGTPGARVLLGPEWSDHLYRQSRHAIATFTEVFERFASSRSKHELYHEAQQRKIALAPMNDFADVLEDPQLLDRHFFQRVDDPYVGTELVYPGRPYRIDGMPAFARRPAPAPGEHSREVLETLLDLDDAELARLEETGVV